MIDELLFLKIFCWCEIEATSEASAALIFGGMRSFGINFFRADFFQELSFSGVVEKTSAKGRRIFFS